MPWTRISSCAASSADANISGCALNSVGANLIVVGLCYNRANTFGGLTDTQGNAWTLLPSAQPGVYYNHYFYYCINPKTAASHGFNNNTSGGAGYPAIAVACFNSGGSLPVFDKAVGGQNNGPVTSSGALTPAAANALLVAWVGGAVAGDAGVATVDSGFTLNAEANGVPAKGSAGSTAYQVQTTATARNLTATFDNSGYDLTVILAAFNTAAIDLAGAAGFRVATVASLAIAATLSAPAAFALGASATLTSPRPLDGAAAFTVASIGTLTAPTRFAVATGLRISASASFVPPTMLGAAGFQFSTRAEMVKSPHETRVGIDLAGEDVTERVRKSGLRITDILNDAPNTCQLVIEGAPPLLGQAIRVTLDSGATILFAGTVQSVDQSYDLVPDKVSWQVRAIDDTGRANARRPFGVWVSTSASTIATAITPAGFSTSGIVPNLPPVSLVLDGTDTVIAALARLATAIGGYTKVENQTVYLFLEDVSEPPDPIDAAHPFLNEPPIRVTTDASQLRTRVFGKGYGENILADLAAGETLVPVPDGANFQPLGGRAIAATTADGAQSQHLIYTGVSKPPGGSLVGTGAAPSNAPVLALAPGGAVTNGVHQVAVLHVTASGKSLVGPTASIDVNPVTPAAALAAGEATNGTGPDEGSHDYVVTFALLGGETTPGPVSNPATTSAGVGQLAPPAGQPSPQPPTVGAGVPQGGTYDYVTTFLNALGETTPSPVSGAVTANPTAPVQPAGYSGSTSATTGGSIEPGTYIYFYTNITAKGESLPTTNALSVQITAPGNAVDVPTAYNSDPRVTGVKIYRASLNENPLGQASTSHYLGTAPNGYSTWKDTLSNASVISHPPPPTVDTTSEPRGQIPIVNILTGPAGTTGRKLYRRYQQADASHWFLVATLNNNAATTYTDTAVHNPGAATAPTSNTTGTAVQKIPLTAIPLGPGGTTARHIYRRFNGTGLFKRVTTLANNTATTFLDTVANSALGVTAPASNTALGNTISVSGIPTGATSVTARELYMSAAGSSALHFVQTLPDNTTTTASIAVADAALTGAAPPVSDTSGLQQPQGQVVPGSPSLVVASGSPFIATGGWVVLGGGQVVRYASINGNTLNGIPAAGPGAIQTAVTYGSPAIPAATLTGVTGLVRPMQRGSAVHVWVQRDDIAAQTEHAARTGGDGVVEFVIVDTRRGADSLAARCDADLALYSRPIVTVTYATRDMKTRSGKQVVINLASPPIAETLTIQEVTITDIDQVRGLAPRYEVKASSVRSSLEDTLRRLMAATPTAERS